MFEREQGRRLSEGGVVERRDVPHRVRPDPDGQSDVRPCEYPDDPRPCEALGESRRDTEHEQERRPLGEHDVLEQVRPHEVVARERVERRHRATPRAAHSRRGTRRLGVRAGLRARPDEVQHPERDGDERLQFDDQSEGLIRAPYARGGLRFPSSAGVAQW